MDVISVARIVVILIGLGLMVLAAFDVPALRNPNAAQHQHERGDGEDRMAPADRKLFTVGFVVVGIGVSLRPLLGILFG